MRFIRRIVYTHVRRIVNTFQVKLLVPYSQGFEINLERLGEGGEFSGGVCYSLVSLFFKYTAEKLNTTNFRIVHPEHFFLGFTQYVRHAQFFLERSMLLQPYYFKKRKKYELVNSIEMKLHNTTGVYGEPVVSANLREKCLIVVFEGNAFTGELDESEDAVQCAVANMCRREKNVEIHYVYSKYYIDPTTKFVGHKKDYYKKPQSLFGLLNDLIYDVGKYTFGDNDYLYGADLTVAGGHHITAIIYDKKHSHIFFFDPNLGIIMSPVVGMFDKTLEMLNYILNKMYSLRYSERKPLLLVDFYCFAAPQND